MNTTTTSRSTLKKLKELVEKINAMTPQDFRDLWKKHEVEYDGEYDRLAKLIRSYPDD